MHHSEELARDADGGGRREPELVSERLGRSSVVLTPDTYSHILFSMHRAAADKLAGGLFFK